MYINVAEAVSGIPASWPGYDLRYQVLQEAKSCQIQEQLNTISRGISCSSVGCDRRRNLWRTDEKFMSGYFRVIFGLEQTGNRGLSYLV